MRRTAIKELATSAFDIVRTVGLALPDAKTATKYDGSPVLKVDGIFLAGLATHPSAEPDTLNCPAVFALAETAFSGLLVAKLDSASLPARAG
jgi:hypothetical protein